MYEMMMQCTKWWCNSYNDFWVDFNYLDFDKEPSKSLSEENKLLSVTSVNEEKHEEYESEQPNVGYVQLPYWL